jgi:hypothetical protein
VICYLCGAADLELAELWPRDRKLYRTAQIVMRQCQYCGLEQNHVGDDECLSADEASDLAPDIGDMMLKRIVEDVMCRRCGCKRK